MVYTQTVNFGESGLTSVGYTIYDENGDLYQARQTTGVKELGTSGVYLVRLNIPDNFAGILVWDDGQTERLYASQGIDDFSERMFGIIKDNTDYILQSIGQHRKEVEPIIGKMDAKELKKEIEKGIKELKEFIDKMKKENKSTIENLKQAVKDIRIPEAKIIINEVDKNLQAIERLYADYQNIISAIKISEKNITQSLTELNKLLGKEKEDGVNEITSFVDNTQNELLLELKEDIKDTQDKIKESISNDIKNERKASEKVLIENYQTFIKDVIKRIESNSIFSLGLALKPVVETYIKAQEKITPENPLLKKMRIILGPKKK